MTKHSKARKKNKAKQAIIANYTRVEDSLSLFTKKSMNIGIEKYLHFKVGLKRFFKPFPLQLIISDHTFLVYLHFLL